MPEEYADHGELYAPQVVADDALLCVPIAGRPGPDGAIAEPELMLRTAAGVGLVLTAYSSVELLVQALGGDQPWAVLPYGALQSALVGSPAVGICLDVPVLETDDTEAAE